MTLKMDKDYLNSDEKCKLASSNFLMSNIDGKEYKLKMSKICHFSYISEYSYYFY